MAATDKDLETLRREHKDLSDYAARVAFVSLTVLFLLTISVSRAWNRVQNKDVTAKLCKIGVAHSNHQQCRIPEDADDGCEDINVSFVFGLQVEENDDVEACSGESRPPQYPAPTPTPCRELPQELRQQKKAEYCTQQTNLENELEKDAQSWFLVKIPVPGIDATLDLRSWILGLPVIFCLFGIYLYIIRKKLTLLEAAAIDRLRNSKPDDVTQLDRLYFEGDRAFLSFPSRVSASLVKLGFVILPVYLIYSVWTVALSFDEYGGNELILALISIVAVSLFYAVAYAQFAGWKLERQTATVTGVEDVGQESMFARGKRVVGATASVIDPRLTLVLGAVGVLLTLIMPMTKEGFWARRNYMGYREYLGYQMLAGGKPNWTSVPGYLGEVFLTYDRLGRGIYLLSLLVALSAISLSIPGVSRAARKWIVRLAAGGVSLTLSFVIVDFSISLINGLGDISWTYYSMFALKLVAVLTTSLCGLWAAYLISRGGARQTRGREKRAIIVAIYTPLFLVAVLFSRWINLEGPAVYLAGLLFLFIGLAHLRQREAAPEL